MTARAARPTTAVSADRLQALMDTRDLTVEQVAATLCGGSPDYWAAAEAGEVSPTPGWIRMITEALGDRLAARAALQARWGCPPWCDADYHDDPLEYGERPTHRKMIGAAHVMLLDDEFEIVAGRRLDGDGLSPDRAIEVATDFLRAAQFVRDILWRHDDAWAIDGRNPSRPA